MHNPIFLTMVGFGILLVVIGTWVSRRFAKSSSSFDEAISKAGPKVFENQAEPSKRTSAGANPSESTQAKTSRERLKKVLHQPQERERLVCLVARQD